jgi:hypothetical protein
MVIALLLGTAGCRVQEAECSSELAQRVVTDILRQELIELARNSARAWSSDTVLPPSEARAAIARLGFSLQGVRTASRDPNSSKRFCEGQIKVSFPVEYLTRAEDRRDERGLTGMAYLEDAMNVERNTNSVSAPISYSVQPTDDGSELYAETDKRAAINLYLAELLAAALATPLSAEGAGAAMVSASERAVDDSLPPAPVPAEPHRDVRPAVQPPTVVVIDPGAEENDDF